MKAQRGFALMDLGERQRISRLGGLAVGHSEHMSRIGMRGGRTVSRDRAHMAKIGLKGGLSLSANRQHMAEIGRKGGLATVKAREVAGGPRRKA